MAIEKFWSNIWTAASLVVPRAGVDSPKLDEARIETALRRATFWLTPGSIKGYDPADFDFLEDAERDQLEDGVKDFSVVARSIPKNVPSTSQQVDQGVAGFRKILEVIRPDRYADLAAFVCGKKIERLARDELPEWVKEMVFKSGNDHLGDPALWIWVEVEDSAIEDAVLGDHSRLIREILHRTAAEACPERWPYVRFRTVSEQKQIQAINVE